MIEDIEIQHNQLIEFHHFPLGTPNASPLRSFRKSLVATARSVFLRKCQMPKTVLKYVFSQMPKTIFPECVARVPVSLWGCGGEAVFAENCVSATVRNRPQPFATVCVSAVRLSTVASASGVVLKACQVDSLLPQLYWRLQRSCLRE